MRPTSTTAAYPTVGQAWAPVPPPPLARTGTVAVRRRPTRAEFGLGFFLFALVNAVLFIRPPEIFPALEGYPIYNAVMIACIIASFPVLVRQLTWQHLRTHPTTLCVILLLPTIWFSLFWRGYTADANTNFQDFLKVLIYFLLLTGLVNTGDRLRRFTIITIVFVLVIGTLATLNYHGVFQLNGIEVEDRIIGHDLMTGAAITVPQLYGPGIFNDPNDFALILGFAIVLILHGILTTRRWSTRILLVALLIVPGYPYALTNSRGGFLALAAGVVTLAIGRFGWRKSMPLIALALPAMLVLFAGRMTNISLSGNDTAQGRMMLWRQGFAYLKMTLGIGIGVGKFEDSVGHVCHNSFVQAYVEMGLWGGALFAQAFWTPIRVLWRKRPATLGPPTRDEALLEWWRPGLLAGLVCYVIGLCTLSKTYTVSTYMIIGLGLAYCGIVQRYRPSDVPPLDRQYCGRFAKVGIGVLAAFYLWCRLI